MKAQILTTISAFVVLVVLGFVLKTVLPKGGAYTESNTANMRQVMVGTTQFSVEIADTPQKQIQGLSDRPNLPRDNGVLFRFTTPRRYDFWMKDMLFSIDFVWIRGGKVVGVTENARHEAPRTIYSPPEAVDMILEINAGVVREKGIVVGDIVELLP